jgi:alpha-galactosidase
LEDIKGDPDAAPRAAYKKMHLALQAAKRPIVYSIIQYGHDDVWTWAHPWAGGNLWRTTDDIDDSWETMSQIGFSQDGLEKFAGPGHWNDPDMLEVGNGGMTNDEYRTHMSLWCLLAAPLIAGNDLTAMTQETLDLLANREVIAVDQDPRGIQGHRVSKQGDLEVWAKQLVDGVAVGLFNRGGQDHQPVTVSFSRIGVKPLATVRNLWGHEDLGQFENGFTAPVPKHGAVLVKIKSPLL